MKGCINNFKQFFIFLFVTFLLISCGGSSDDSKKYTISADVTTVNFANEFVTEFDESIAVTVNFDGDGLLLAFTPDAEIANWLSFRTENLTATSATVHIDLINADQMLSGEYNTTVRLSTGDLNNTNLVHHDIDVSLLIWQASVSKDSLSFLTTKGGLAVSEQTFEVVSAASNWTISSDVSWLSFDITSGSTAETITASVDMSAFTDSGLNEGNIIITETSSGDTKLIPVEVGNDDIYLYADRPSLAFTETASNSVLQQTITIQSNNPNTQIWQAISSVDWLTLDKIGIDQLEITANTSSLPQEDISTANIVISDSANSDVISETITVNLYRSAELDGNKSISNLTLNDDALVSAPSLPYFYVGVDNKIEVYHQYTAELIYSAVVSPAETALENFIVHPTGKSLIAQADETVTAEDGSESTTTHRYSIDLTNYSITEIFDAAITTDPIGFIRLSGRYFIVTKTLEFSDALFAKTDTPYNVDFLSSKVDVAYLANSFFALDSTNNEIKRFTVEINDYTTSKISIALTHSYQPSSFVDNDILYDINVSVDESTLYVMAPNTEWLSFDGTDFTDNGMIETNPVYATAMFLEDSQQQAIFIRWVSGLGAYFFIYDENQTELPITPLTANFPYLGTLSGDDERFIIYTGPTVKEIEIIGLN